MNIFAAYDCPQKSALILDNKRLVKMVLETSQLLSTALVDHTGVKQPRKATHAQHPVAVWVRANTGNYAWTLELFAALNAEYTARYGRVHADAGFYEHYAANVGVLPAGDRTPFANCAANMSIGVNYKHIADVHLAYRLYLAHRWELDKRTPQWHNPAAIELAEAAREDFAEYLYEERL